MSAPLLTEQDEKDLVYAGNVVTAVHQLLFGHPCAYFVTAQHGWDQAWMVCVHENPGQVTVTSIPNGQAE